MKSETIFSYTSVSRNRYGGKSQNKVVIFSDASDITKWPYVIKRFSANIQRFSNMIDEEEVDSINISKEIFDKIKWLISQNTRLISCKENIDNLVMDATSESFYFGCDTFSKSIGGLSILGSAYSDLDKSEESRSDNYYVLKTYTDIKELLEKQGIYVL